MTDANRSSRLEQSIRGELHAELLGEFATETEAWVGERLARVMARLNAAGTLAAAVFRKLSHGLYGPDRETQADQYSVELCLNAGYDGERCLRAFDILENESLNRGDVDGVFGPENLLDPTDPGQGSRAYAIQRWLWIHAHRYLPLHERGEIALAYHRRRLVERRDGAARANSGD
jgi:hypothetical protein